MEELLTHYSLEQVILFIIMLAASIKTIITFWDWMIDRLHKIFNKQTLVEQDKKSVINRIDEDETKLNILMEKSNVTEKQIEALNSLIQMLIQSDKDDIKSWITEQHHKFCYGKSRTIDAYSLDCIEKRYNHYKEEGGNSFVHTLMEDIRKLTVYYPDQEKKQQ